jgi:hypothetical protein
MGTTSPVAPVEPEIAPAPESPENIPNKKINIKLICAGAGAALLIGVLVTCGAFGRASTPAKPAGVTQANKDANKAAAPVATAPAETNPAPAQVSNDAAPAAASWIPVYPGTKPEITSSANTPENDQNISTFKTGDAPPKVISYFQEQLTKSGFNIKSASSGEDNGSLLAEDGARKRSLVLSVNAVPGAGTEARLVTIEKK